MKKFIPLMIISLFPLAVFSQELDVVDEIAPFSEGLAAVRLGEKWGFMDQDGKLVIDFRSDLVWNTEADPAESDVTGIRYPQFQNGLCVIQEILEEEGIAVYGFINTQGETVIRPEYLNVTEFRDDFALGILLTKTFRGQNRFQLNIYDYKFSEVILDSSGEIHLLVTQRNNILMDKRRYEIPELTAKYISRNIMAVRTGQNTWELRKIKLLDN